MNGNDSRKTMRAMPLERGYEEASRAARVAALKARVAGGTYRLDARAVAAAMIEEGAIAPATSPFDLAQPAEMRRAMRRFVVEPTREHPARPRGRLRVVSAG